MTNKPIKCTIIAKRVRTILKSLSFLLAFFLFSCAKENNQSTFQEYRNVKYIESTQKSIEMTDIYNKFKEIPEPELPAPISEINSAEFTIGIPNPTAFVDYSSIPQFTENVEIPHRIFIPNQDLWYRLSIESEQDLVLMLNPDDGAQVWWGQEQIRQLMPNTYLLNNKSAETELVARCMNNAVMGGLRYARIYTKEGFTQYSEAENKYNRLKHLVEKVYLLNNQSGELINALSEAVNQYSIDAIENVENLFTEKPLIIIGPYLKTPSETSMIVAYETDIQTQSTIEWGISKNQLDKTLQPQNDGTFFTAKFENLEKGKTYYYRIINQNTVSDIYSFATFNISDKFNFAVWGDYQGGWDIARKHSVNILKHNPEFVIVAGDLPSWGYSHESWKDFFGAWSELFSSKPTYFAAGNHEYDAYYDDMTSEHFLKYSLKDVSYGMFSYGNCGFIYLDPNLEFPVGITSGSEQYDWFTNTVLSEEFQSYKWRFIVVHQPPYSEGWKNYEGDVVIRDLLVPYAKQGLFDFVLSGHTHDYERLTIDYETSKTTYMILGGGGGNLESEGTDDRIKMDVRILSYNFGLFEINGNTLTFSAIDENNKVIDTFTFKKD